MADEIKYIELKSGYNDDGPAWIGKVKTSKTGKTIYFNGHAFQKCIGAYSNYYDIESGEDYWISGIKKDSRDRHWAGHGKIIVDRKVLIDYLNFIGEKELDLNRYSIMDIADDFPIERINKLLNRKE